MTQSDEELHQLAKAATPGPWRLCGRIGYAFLVATPAVPVAAFYGAAPEGSDADGNAEGEQNAAFVAAANPQAIMDLLARAGEMEDDAVRLASMLLQTIRRDQVLFWDPDSPVLRELEQRGWAKRSNLGDRTAWVHKEQTDG